MKNSITTESIEFSVLMSVYYKERSNYLQLALDSIWFNQSIKPSEIVIVKDGPLTPELDAILESFSRNAPVKFIVNEVNKGLSESLNNGLLACSNNIVARMDTDDICFENRFKTQLDFLLNHSDVDVVGSYAVKMDECGNEIGLLKRPLSNVDIYKYVWSNPFIHPSIMFKRESILKVGNYQLNAGTGTRHDDYELWFRCAAAGLNFANIPKTLIYYRFFEETVTRNNLNVAWNRFKVGIKGSYKLKSNPIAYFGISIPLFRSLLPYPLNVYFNKLMVFVNPRNK